MAARLLLLALLLAASVGACGSESTPRASDERATTDARDDAEKDVNGSRAAAERLASIHERSPVVQKALIRRYADALDRLEPYCREPRRRLADFAVYSAWQRERQRDIATKPLEMLDGVYEFVRKAVTPTRCRTAFVATVRFRHE